LVKGRLYNSVLAQGKGAKAGLRGYRAKGVCVMATNPSPEPDTGPIEHPQPTTPPAEMPPMPGDIDQPAPVSEPETMPPAQRF
jgi:hypothetical protein